MPTAEAAPLADDEVDRLLAPLAAAGRIALAVSGGADSLALAECVARWRTRRGGGPEAIVLTVDHRLRRGSAREAAGVAAMARGHGLAARVLRWTGPRPKANIEAAARRARYRLLLTAAAEAGASHLVLAHHRDDQAETFLMRLERGAGVFGLAAMRREVTAGAIVIVRPFLDVPRARLAATAAAAGLEPVDDPMNRDPRFARARVRRVMPLLAAAGLDAALIARSAARLGEAAVAIDAAASALIGAAVTTDAMAVARLDPAAFAAAPEAVRQRALVRVLLAVGGDDYPPRRERGQRLATALAAHRAGRFKRTLAGTVIEWRKPVFVVYRELGRDGLLTLPLRPGAEVAWDHRFAVRLGRGAPAGLTVGALGEAGRRLVGAAAGDAPAGALAGLPAIRKRGRILGVPPLGHVGRGGEGLAVTVRPLIEERLARPPLFPDFAAEG